MNQIYRIGIFCLFALSLNTSFASEITTAPPDSTSSLIDRSAAILLIEEGKTAWSEGKVRDALIKFRQASVKDPYSWKALFWISKCHYRMNNYGYALQYGNEALNIGDEKIDEEIYYVLGLAYHRMENLDTAILMYEKAIELMPKMRSSELRIEHNIKHCQYAKEQLKTEAKYERQQMPGEVNSGYDDYGIVLTSEDTVIYFSGRRNNTTGGGLNPDDQQYFEDTYRAVYDEEMESWETVSNELGKLNSVGFDALNYISPDGTWGVMTLNTTMSDEKKTTRVSDICEIKKNTKGTWNSPKPIKNKTINTSYFDGAATLTADGNTMYFVSDRKGEKKSTDIYYVERDGKKWGTAKPLPDNINTVGRETTPYVTPNGQYLFFSSDGHEEGMGGTDIYVCRYLGNGTWSDPVNLGNGINTVNNDTHFVYSEKMQKGFVAGLEIVGNKASIDIYEIDMKGFEFPK